jgi:hypothetical protein
MSFLFTTAGSASAVVLKRSSGRTRFNAITGVSFNRFHRKIFQIAPIASVTTIEKFPALSRNNNNNGNNNQHQQSNHRSGAMQFIPTVAAAAAAVGLSIFSSNRTDCCGIVGVVGTGNYDARLVHSVLII